MECLSEIHFMSPSHAKVFCKQEISSVECGIRLKSIVTLHCKSSFAPLLQIIYICMVIDILLIDILFLKLTIYVLAYCNKREY